MQDTDWSDHLTPARIAAVYIAVGLAGLAFSDLVLPRLLAEPLLRRAQLLKGAVEVVLTGGLVYGLVWYGQRSLRAVNRRLERNDQVLQVLLRLLRHNIRNEMNVIQGHAAVARSSADRDDVEDSCHAILSTADELLRQTETVNELREMLEGATERRTFEVGSLVENVLGEARDGTDRELVTVTEDVDDVDISANDLLPVALGEVVDNAVRYNDGPRPRVEFATEVGEEVVDLHVADDGPGIPEEELAVLAEREESPLVHSSGLGLWFVYWIVNDSGGAVSIRVRETGGTVVTLSLPRAARAESIVEDEMPVAAELLGAE